MEFWKFIENQTSIPRSKVYLYFFNNLDKLSVAIKRLWELISPDINWEFDEYARENENFFDYKKLFKNSKSVKSMTGRIKKEYTKDIVKDPASEFSNIYETSK